jgi:hypothetical protein
MTLTLTHLDANGTDPRELLASDFAGGSPLSVLIQLGCFGTVPRVREPGDGGVVLRQSGEAGDNVGLRPTALKAEQFEPQSVHDKAYGGGSAGPVKLPLCLCAETPQKRPQMCYFFGLKCAIVDKDVTFPRRDYM